MLEFLTGAGLAASAGLNAWIPLFAVGLIARYTDLLTLPPTWEWLSNGWALGILAALLVAEVVADKIPVLDSVNDVLYTLIRPTSGGIAFGAGVSGSDPAASALDLSGADALTETVAVSDPGAFFGAVQWVPVAAGVVIALVVHAFKALARPVVNAATLGIGGPIMSTAEDVTSVTMSIAAILLPVLILFFLIGLAVFFWWAMRHRFRHRARAAGSQTNG